MSGLARSDSPIHRVLAQLQQQQQASDPTVSFRDYQEAFGSPANPMSYTQNLYREPQNLPAGQDVTRNYYEALQQQLQGYGNMVNQVYDQRYNQLQSNFDAGTTAGLPQALEQPKE